MSVHQSAQTDRASVAYNFYAYDMNFFTPRVSDHRHTSGIVGCEFPLVNYMAAVSYKLFGFNDSHYRIIMWLFMSFGVFAAYSITRLFLESSILSLVISFIWYLSPILVYYTANFIPDTASLSCTMIGLYGFVSLYKNGFTRRRLVLMTVFLSLAGLIKITSLIPVLAILITLLWSWSFNKETIQKKGIILIATLVPIVLTISWYSYANYLSTKHGTVHFLLSVPLVKSWSEFKEAFNIFYSNWWFIFYPKGTLYFIYAVIALLIVKSFKKWRFTLVFSWLLLLGAMAFFLLMVIQFRYHDYYLICLSPMVLFLLIFLAQWMKVRKFFLTKLVLFSLFVILLNYGFHWSKKNLTSRYTPGNYWCQSDVQPKAYLALANEMNRLKLPKDTSTFVFMDKSPNSILYFTGLRGFRFTTETKKEQLVESYPRYKPHYVLVNDSSYFEIHPEDIKLKKVLTVEGIDLYQAEYENKK